MSGHTLVSCSCMRGLCVHLPNYAPRYFPPIFVRIERGVPRSEWAMLGCGNFNLFPLFFFPWSVLCLDFSLKLVANKYRILVYYIFAQNWGIKVCWQLVQSDTNCTIRSSSAFSVLIPLITISFLLTALTEEIIE